jgi:glycosyltransferase involved in cell wall biosynthesis
MILKLLSVFFSFRHMIPKSVRNAFKRSFPELTMVILGRDSNSVTSSRDLLAPAETIIPPDASNYLEDYLRNSISQDQIAVIGPLDPLPSGIAWNTTKLYASLSKLKKSIVFETPSFRQPKSTQPNILPIGFLDILERKKLFEMYLVIIGNGNHYQDTLIKLGTQKNRNMAVLLHDVNISGIESPTNGSNGLKGKDKLGLSKLPLDTKLILVHSKYARELVLRNLPESFGKTRVEVLETGVPLDVSKHYVTSRSRPTKTIVGTAGFFDFSKNPYLSLDALAIFAKNDMNAQIEWVGQISEHYMKLLMERWEKHGLEKSRLTFLGYLDEINFRKSLSRWSCAINLRQYTNGESSGVVAELAAAGTPVIVSDIGSFTELQDDVFKKVPINAKAIVIAREIDVLVNSSANDWTDLSDKLVKWSSSRSFENYSTEILNFMESMNGNK